MALELFTKSEQEILSPFAKTPNASSITLGHFVPEDEDMFIIKSQKSPSSCHSTSASEAGDDPCSTYSPLLDTDSSDDEKMSTPRSADINAGSCVYSVMFLLAALPKCASSTSSVLGYRSEVVPEDVERFPTASDKTYKAKKSKSKQAPKGRSQACDEMASRLSLPTDSNDSWVAKQRTKASIDEDAKVIRAARSILNKLTLEKFDNLFSQLVACGIDTPSHLSTLMHEIFEKATMQHKFIPMYAELCVRLETDPHITSVVEGSNLHSFRSLLLNQCQKVFEELLEPSVAESIEVVAVDEEAKMLRKQQALGNIKLIGELIVQGMLSSNLFVDCGNKLLQSRASCPEALESLAALIMVAGPKFDKKDWQHHSELKALLAGIADLTKDKSTPARVRFLLRDVLDVRSAGWHTSVNQAALKTAPMKLDEVREKAAAEDHGITSVTFPKAAIGSNSGLQRLTEICKQPWAVNALRVEDKKCMEEGCSVESSQKQSKSNSSSGLSRLADICRLPVAESKHSEEVVSVRTPLALKPKKQKCKTTVVQVAEARPVGLQCCTQKASEEKTSCEEAPAKSQISDNVAVPMPTQTIGADVAVPMPTQTIESSAAIGSVFDLVTFRRALSATLTKLASEKNAPAAVQYIRLQEVPVEFQAGQFVDILSRIVEERRGAVRRCQFAFAAGLMQGDLSPFEQKACFDGIALFFKDVYVEMCGEIPRLPAILKSEFVPTLRNVFPSEELNAILPEEMYA